MLAAAAGLVILLGWALRTLLYLRQPALWVDEARLALNIASRSWWELLAPLDHDQTAPVLFLWGARLATRLAGVHEPSLRAVPFLAGLALLPALWAAGRRLLGARAALLAVILAAGSPLLVRYSNEVKQYELDALAAVGALGLFALATGGEGARNGRRAILALGGVLLLLMSQAAPFALLGLALALLSRRTVTLRGLLPALGAWLATFLLLYFLSYRQVAGSEYMQAFWQETYPRPTADDFGFRAWWLARTMLLSPFSPGADTWSVKLVAAVFVLGVWAAWRMASSSHAVLLLVPFAGLAAAAALGRYPVSPRLALVLVPGGLLLYGAALGYVTARLPPRARSAAFWAAAAGLLGLGLANNRPPGVPGPGPWNARTLAALVRESGAEEPVYLYAGAIPAWAFYSTDWNAPDERRLRRIAALAGAGGPAFENAASRNAAVRCEGDSLEGRQAGRVELYGVPTGVQAVEPLGWRKLEPDSGWAENEARRILGAGAGRMWIYATHYRREWIAALLDAVTRAGGVVREGREDPDDEEGASLYRVEIPPGARAAGSAPTACPASPP